MIRLRRLFRAKSSVDLLIVAFVLCTCVFVLRQLNQRTAAHKQTAKSDDVDDNGQLLEISLGDPKQQQQQLVSSPTPVELHHNTRTHDVDQRIMHIGDFRSDNCRSVSTISVVFCLAVESES